MKLGLIDECWLYIHPVVLGGGKPAFPAEYHFLMQVMSQSEYKRPTNYFDRK